VEAKHVVKQNVSGFGAITIVCWILCLCVFVWTWPCTSIKGSHAQDHPPSYLSLTLPISLSHHHQPPKVRSSITPGTVLILLAGRFRGKRVVCLNVLPSGLILVSGPYKINGVPLRRVNPAYVIATSTKVDVTGIDVSPYQDAFFAREKATKADGEDDFFLGDAPQPAIVSEARKAAQETVDATLLKAVAATPMLEGYLAARFTLNANDKPHLMKF
jgi:large subunit ribosomal protein L6e